MIEFWRVSISKLILQEQSYLAQEESNRSARSRNFRPSPCSFYKSLGTPGVSCSPSIAIVLNGLLFCPDLAPSVHLWPESYIFCNTAGLNTAPPKLNNPGIKCLSLPQLIGFFSNQHIFLFGSGRAISLQFPTWSLLLLVIGREDSKQFSGPWTRAVGPTERNMKWIVSHNHCLKQCSAA